MRSMFNPRHPGLTLRDDILPALNLQVGEAAAQLGVDRTTLSKVLNGRAAISPAMALRIVILPLFSILLKPPIMRTFFLAAGPLSSVAQTSSG